MNGYSQKNDWIRIAISSQCVSNAKYAIVVILFSVIIGGIARSPCSPTNAEPYRNPARMLFQADARPDFKDYTLWSSSDRCTFRRNVESIHLLIAAAEAEL